LLFLRHRRSQGGQRSHALPKFLENVVILCFERCFSKQNSVIRLKSSTFPPKFLVWLRHCLKVGLVSSFHKTCIPKLDRQCVSSVYFLRVIQASLFQGVLRDLNGLSSFQRSNKMQSKLALWPPRYSEKLVAVFQNVFAVSKVRP